MVAVFLNSNGKVLLAKRADNGAWQFPQGGKDPGETSLEALYREMEEELAVSRFSVIKKSKNLVRYDFPSDLEVPIAKNYKGQEQEWFLCVLGPDELPHLDLASTPEFTEVKWDSLSVALEQVVHWKKASYEKGLQELGLLDSDEEA